MYNHGTRMRKIVCEASLKLVWTAIVPWMRENLKEEEGLIDNAIHSEHYARNHASPLLFSDVSKRDSFSEVFDLFEVYSQAQVTLQHSGCHTLILFLYRLH